MKFVPPELSIIIPVFNEAQCVNLVFKELKTSLDKIDHEIIFVDDGSSDGTGDILEKIKNIDQDQDNNQDKDKDQHKVKVHVISFAARCGKACAQQAGISLAKGDFIIFMDGDGQDDPADIPKLLNRIKGEKAAMVVGRRVNRISGGFYLFSSLVFNFFIRMVTGIRIRDINASMKIVKTAYLKSISLYAGNYRFLPLLLHTRGGEGC